MRLLRDRVTPPSGTLDEAAPADTAMSAGWIARLRRLLTVDALPFGLVAITIGLRAQEILTPGQLPSPYVDIASATRWYMIAVAVLLFGWSTSYRNRSLLRAPAEYAENLWGRIRSKPVARRLGLVGAAIVVDALSIGILQGNWNSWPGGILWLASMLVLVAAFVGERPVARSIEAEDDTQATYRWRWPLRYEVAAFALVIAVALVMRLWRLGDLAPGMHGDEGEAGTQALAILHGNLVSPFLRGWFNQSNVYYWTLAVFMKVFGTGLFGLRMFAFTCGMVTVVFTYLVAREMFGIRAAIIAGAFMSFQSVDLMFSRQEFSNVTVPPLLAIMFYFLIRGLRTRAHLDFVIAGLSGGLGVYYFAGGRLIGPVGGCFLLYLAVTRRRFLRGYWTRCLAFGVAFCLMIAPFAAYFIAVPILGMQYPNDRFIWLHHSDLAAQYGSSSWTVIVWGQLTRTLSVLTYGVDQSAMSVLNFPAARPLEAVLIVLGLAWTAWRWRDTRFGALNIWFWSSIIAGGVLTTQTPNLPRILGILPVLAIVIAAVLDHLAAHLTLALARLGETVGWTRTGQWLGGTAICAAILVSGLQNKSIYIDYYLNTHPNTIVSGQAMYVQHFGLGYRYYGMGAPAIYWTHGDNRFINPHADGTDAVNPSTVLPLTDNGPHGTKPANFLVWPNMYDYLSALKAYYPVAHKVTYHLGDPSNATPPLIGYVLSAAQIQARRTVRLTLTPRAGSPVSLTEPTVGTSIRLPARLHYPVRAVWAGGIVVPNYGPFRFDLRAPGGAQLAIDGLRLLAAPGMASARLAQGVHAILLSATLRDPSSNVSLQWAAGVGRLRAIDRRSLWDDHIGTAWLAKIQPVVPGATPADAFYRVDGFLGYRDTGQALGFYGPFVGTWASTLVTRRAGLYRFELNSLGTSSMTIDGRRVIENHETGSDPHAVDGAIRLSIGRHLVEVRYQWDAGVGYLEAWWTPPGGKRRFFVTGDLHLPRPAVWQVRATVRAARSG